MASPVQEPSGRERAFRLYGRATPPEPPIELRAGPVSALLVGPDLRHVRIAGNELVQRVYVAVRDAPWNTIPAEYADWERDIGADRFLVRFSARHRHEAIDFRWAGRIEGTPDGRIAYEMDGTCHGVFRYSKIGLNVHHGLQGSVGRRYRARHGERTWDGVLPTAIDPQRIVDGSLSGMFDPYQELAIEVADGLEAVVALEGDLLELQDHRNWIDANFKSYATPLALGFPFDSSDGQPIHQLLTIGHRGAAVARPAPSATIEVGPALGHRMPAVGLGMASDARPLSPSEATLVAALRPDHLRIDLTMRLDAWRHSLERAVADAAAVGAALELALHVPPDVAGELDRLTEALARTAARTARVLVYPLSEGFSAVASTTPPALVARVSDALRPVIGPAVVAGGTDQSFADINRARPTDPRMAGSCFSVSPTVHAADDASIMENLAGLSAVVRFAREIAAPRSIHVSPVTLATRFGPYPDGPAGPDDLPPAVDPRQLALVGAAWTAASVGELARAGAESVTYYETAGWRGVVEREAGSPMPDRFPSRRGQAFPLYHPLADAAGLHDGLVHDLQPEDPLLLGGFAVRAGEGMVVVVANLTADVVRARLKGLQLGPTTVRTLDEATMDRAADDPAAFRTSGTLATVSADGLRLDLGPYATVRIDV